MKRIRWDWRLLKLIAESRGFLIKEIPGQLPVKKFKKRKGLAESTLHGKAKKGKPASRRIAEYLVTEEGLPTRKGFEKTSKVVRLGLAAMNGLPTPTVAGKLDALSNKLDATHAHLDARLDINGAKLDSHTSKLDAHGGKLDALLAELVAFRAEHKSGRHVTGTVLGILLLVGLFAGRQVLTNTSNAVASPSPAVAFRVGVRQLLDLGKKPEEFWIPDAPYSWQKLAKDCDASAGEKAINGGCWVGVIDVKPPCGKLFRHGDICYRPVIADPTKPVGLVRTVPGELTAVTTGR